MLTSALFVLAILYFAAAVIAALAAGRASPRPSTTRPSTLDDRPSLTVIVAARNEEYTLGGCLQALRAQTYPSERYEIIVANDHSSDRTREIAEEHGVACVDVPEGARGKASALHAAVEASSGEILVATDADCRPPARWLDGMAAQFADEGVGMVCGVTAVAGRSLLARIQAADWTLLLTVAAGLSALGYPLSAMGNNMAFRRTAYEGVGGYPALQTSVTEDYELFRAIGASHEVRLVLDPRLKNVTLPLSRLRDVVAQRRRWARGGLRAGAWTYLFYAFVYAAHAAIAASLVIDPLLGIGALAVKVVGDLFVLKVGGATLGQRHLRLSLAAYEAFLFGYVIALPVLLVVAPRIEWRGRRW